MITLQEFFDTLATGEFSNVAIGNSAQQTIKEAKYPTIINGMNLGLVELYKRFTLKTKEINLYEQVGKTAYYLRSDYVATSVTKVSANAYLIDSAEDPFEDDLLKVIDAYDADGEQIHINDKRFPEKGIFTTAFDTIKLTVADEPRVISLVYAAKYPKLILTDDFDPQNINLHFPEWITEPLLLYIAARIFIGKASKVTEGGQNLHTTFMYQFENACKKIELFGLAEMADEPSETFTNNGWV